MITRVTEGVFRGPHPEMLVDLQSRGIKTILSLQTGAQDIFRGRVYVEDEKAEMAGIDVIHVRLDNLRPPTVAQIERCLNLMIGRTQYSGVQLKGTLPIYVHCKHGVDRTGFICAAYRVLVEGWDVEDALQEMREMGFHSWFYLWWPAAFRRRMAEMRPMYAEVRP